MTLATEAPSRATGQATLPNYANQGQTLAGRRKARVLAVAIVFFCLIWGMGFAFTAPYLILFFSAPIAIMAAVVIWALPTSKRAPIGALSPLLFLFMMSLVMWPPYLAIALPNLPWISMTRLTGVPLVVVLLLCASTSREFQSSVVAALHASPLIAGFFIAFNLQEAVSIFYSMSPISSLNAFANSEISLTAIFFVSVFVFLRRGQADRIAGLLWLMGIVVGVIAVFESREGHVLWLGHIPSFLRIDDPSVKLSLRGTTREGAYRVQSTFGIALGLAEYISLILPFVINFAIGSYGRLTRWAAALSIPFLLFVVFLSGSRLGLVGCFVSIVLTGIVWGGPRWARDRRSFVAPVVFLGTCTVTLAAAASVFVVGRVHSIVLGGGATSVSTYARTVQTQMAIPKLLSHPLGHGIGNGAAALGYTTQGGFLTIDSYYINELMEYGFLGFVLFYGIFVLAISQCGRLLVQRRDNDREISLLGPIAVSMVTFFIVKSVFAETSNHPIVFMLLAMAVALSYRCSEQAISQQQSSAPAMLSAKKA